MYNIIIEQTIEYQNRMKFDSENNTFNESEFKSLFYVRGCSYPYGWIKESGTPPGRHLDVILVSSKEYNLGDEVEVKVIGCFVRDDGDNKLVGILPQRLETDINELPEKERAYLHRLYPDINEGEGWYGREKSKEIINNFFKNKF